MDLTPEYCQEPPAPQTMVDILRGSWISAFAKSMGIEAGNAPHFDGDPRVGWADSVLPNGVKGMSVLELGPLEAYHTHQLQQHGAQRVTVVESNNLSFLKCLIVKELFHLNATFLYGDAIKFLEQTDQRFDMCWASGLLYHQTDPLHLLSLMQRVTDTLFIWTHYFDPARILASQEISRYFDAEHDSAGDHLGYKANYYFRSYLQSKGAIFAGGCADFSYWLKKEDIFGFLKHVGFKTITIGVDHPLNPSGPAMFFLARR